MIAFGSKSLLLALVFVLEILSYLTCTSTFNFTFRFSRGDPICPDSLTFTTESALFTAPDLLAGQGGVEQDATPCTGVGFVAIAIDGEGGNRFQTAIRNELASNITYAGALQGTMQCGGLNFFDETVWQFFAPLDDFEVDPSQLLGNNSTLTAGRSTVVRFSQDAQYLVIGDLCIYSQRPAPTLGASEAIPAGPAVPPTEESLEALGFTEAPQLTTPEEIGSSEMIDPSLPSPDSDDILLSTSEPASSSAEAEATSDGSDDDSDAVCFPASATVQLEGGRVKRMEELAVGDRVLSSVGSYSEVFGFTHKLSRAESYREFIRLSVGDETVLLLTPSHYMYLNEELQAARNAVVGDSVILGDGRTGAVTSVSREMAYGLYNPQTVCGDIVVSGVLASTYTQAVDARAAHAGLSMARAAFGWFGTFTTAFEGGSELAAVLPHGASTLA